MKYSVIDDIAGTRVGSGFLSFTDAIAFASDIGEIYRSRCIPASLTVVDGEGCRIATVTVKGEYTVEEIRNALVERYEFAARFANGEIPKYLFDDIARLKAMLRRFNSTGRV